MSIEKRGVRYRVRWWEGSRHRSRTFDKKADAVAFEAEARRIRQKGGIVQLASGIEFEDLCAQYLAHKQDELTPGTWDAYAYLLEKHASPFIGHIPARHLTPKRLRDWQRERLDAGAGRTSIAKTTVIVKAALEFAVQMEFLERNPARALRRPRIERGTEPIAIATPEQIEAMRGYFIARERLFDATLVSVLAYMGLRPGEALGLMWMDLGNKVVHIRRSNTGGHLKSTKTGKTRRVTLDPYAAEDLETWRLDGDGIGFVFPRKKDGEHWKATDWNNWRKRQFNDAREAAGLPEAFRPYDLRHSRASYLIAAGHQITDVAKEMGHSPQMCLRTYAHVFEDRPEGDPREWIKRAREAA